MYKNGNGKLFNPKMYFPELSFPPQTAINHNKSLRYMVEIEMVGIIMTEFSCNVFLDTFGHFCWQTSKSVRKKCFKKFSKLEKNTQLVFLRTKIS